MRDGYNNVLHILEEHEMCVKEGIRRSFEMINYAKRNYNGSNVDGMCLFRT
jgi:hypothetical protein